MFSGLITLLPISVPVCMLRGCATNARTRTHTHMHTWAYMHTRAHTQRTDLLKGKEGAGAFNFSFAQRAQHCPCFGLPSPGSPATNDMDPQDALVARQHQSALPASPPLLIRGSLHQAPTAPLAPAGAGCVAPPAGHQRQRRDARSWRGGASGWQAPSTLSLVTVRDRTHSSALPDPFPPLKVVSTPVSSC